MSREKMIKQPPCPICGKSNKHKHEVVKGGTAIYYSPHKKKEVV